MDDLKTHTSITDEKMQLLKDAIVASDYFRQHDPCGGGLDAPGGGLVAPGQKFYREDGTEHTFRDVPLKLIWKAVRTHIRNYVLRDRQKEVCDKVMARLPRHAREGTPPPNPNKDPATPFSASRAVSLSD